MNLLVFAFLVSGLWRALGLLKKSGVDSLFIAAFHDTKIVIEKDRYFFPGQDILVAPDSRLSGQDYDPGLGLGQIDGLVRQDHAVPPRDFYMPLDLDTVNLVFLFSVIFFGVG